MTDADAWAYIMGSKPKYTSSWRPTVPLPNAPKNVVLEPEERVYYSSPYSKNNNLMKNRKVSEITVRSSEPLTPAQHNKLLNRLKNVTAV